jgi:hypothetical protein
MAQKREERQWTAEANEMPDNGQGRGVEQRDARDNKGSEVKLRNME